MAWETFSKFLGIFILIPFFSQKNCRRWKLGTWFSARIGRPWRGFFIQPKTFFVRPLLILDPWKLAYAEVNQSGHGEWGSSRRLCSEIVHSWWDTRGVACSTRTSPFSVRAKCARNSSNVNKINSPAFIWSFGDPVCICVCMYVTCANLWELWFGCVCAGQSGTWLIVQNFLRPTRFPAFIPLQTKPYSKRRRNSWRVQIISTGELAKFAVVFFEIILRSWEW